MRIYSKRKSHPYIHTVLYTRACTRDSQVFNDERSTHSQRVDVRSKMNKKNAVFFFTVNRYRVNKNGNLLLDKRQRRE